MWQNEREIFEELNNNLARRNVTTEIICVGGFVLNHNGMRATLDIDGFYDSTHTIESAIREVGEKFGINTVDELWLNNSVQNMNEIPDKSICELLYDFSNLKVYLAPLDYVAGMKLISSREQDIIDVAEIIKLKEIADPEVLRTILVNYGFVNVDESLFLEAFGKAYGMDWLEKYYIDHENEILSRL